MAIGTASLVERCAGIIVTITEKTTALTAFVPLCPRPDKRSEGARLEGHGLKLLFLFWAGV
jgi:hypothetical protein